MHHKTQHNDLGTFLLHIKARGLCQKAEFLYFKKKKNHGNNKAPSSLALNNHIIKKTTNQSTSFTPNLYSFCNRIIRRGQRWMQTFTHQPYLLHLAVIYRLMELRSLLTFCFFFLTLVLPCPKCQRLTPTHIRFRCWEPLTHTATHPVVYRAPSTPHLAHSASSGPVPSSWHLQTGLRNEKRGVGEVNSVKRGKGR